MFSFDGTEPVRTDQRWVQISQYDPDYRGYHLAIGLYADPATGGCCQGSHFGYLVQEHLSSVLADLRVRVDTLAALPDERVGCPSILMIIRITGSDREHPAVYRRLVDSYVQAINAVDARR